MLSEPGVEECVRGIAAAGHLNVFLFFDPKRALAEARSAPAGPLNGVAIAVKENIDIAGLPTTSGSLVDRERMAARDAPAWSRLRAAGATLLGKTHMSEFAYGSHHPALGPVRHPLDPERTPGTSSSGSAAAVAAGLCPAALGTDTGGSVRVPPAYCGLVGLKATHRLVPADGVMPLAPSLDDVGVLRVPSHVLSRLSGCRAGCDRNRIGGHERSSQRWRSQYVPSLPWTHA